MLGVTIDAAELYYGVKRRRLAVELSSSLRETTKTAARQMHDMFASGVTPRAERLPKCDRCSLLYLCLPDASAPSRSASRFVGRQFASHARSSGPATDPGDSLESAGAIT